MSQTRFGQCHLCLQEQPLVNSHIIPDFHFKPLKADEGFFWITSTDAKKKEYRWQKGPTEHLLCAKCDNERLGAKEGHLRKVLFGGHPLDGSQSVDFLTVSGYDYHLLKNALLSILWRMSITSHDYFKSVNLGSKHEELLRQALVANTEVDEETYPILLTAPFIGGKFLMNWILPPNCVRVGHNKVYRCLISGFLFAFIVGSAPLEEKFRPFVLRRNGVKILKGDIAKIPFLFQYCMDLAAAMETRSGASEV